jgi:hypothetical protein
MNSITELHDIIGSTEELSYTVGIIDGYEEYTDSFTVVKIHKEKDITDIFLKDSSGETWIPAGIYYQYHKTPHLLELPKNSIRRIDMSNLLHKITGTKSIIILIYINEQWCKGMKHEFPRYTKLSCRK